MTDRRCITCGHRAKNHVEELYECRSCDVCEQYTQPASISWETAMNDIGQGQPEPTRHPSIVDEGHTLARLAGRHLTDNEAAGYGLWWKALEAVGRWSDAVVEGRAVPDDVLRDLATYATTARQVRDGGRAL